MVVTAEDVPMLASGKVDRIGLRELAERARDEGRAWSRD